MFTRFNIVPVWQALARSLCATVKGRRYSELLLHRREVMGLG